MKTRVADAAGKANWKTKVFESLSVPTLILMPDKTIVDANPEFLEKFNLKKEQFVGKTCHDFYYRSMEPCPFETCALVKVLQDRKGHSALRFVTTSTGEGKWDNRVFSPIMDDEGEILYIMECIHDVTPMKVLERELSGVREFTDKLIQSSSCSMIAADRRGRILLMNPVAEQLTGYSFKEVQGRLSAEDLYPPGQAKEIMRILRDERVGGKGKLPFTRVNLIDALGNSVPVELTAAIIYEGEKEVATMAIFNDLREKMKHEERMREMLNRIARAEKMASLGQLAAGVAHEINNPLTGIIFFAQIVLETLADDDPRKDSLACIFEDAKRCGKIVKNLLAYSRQTSPSMEVLHINTLLEHSMGLIRDKTIFTDIRIVKETSEEMMLIRGDRDQLGRAIVNLVMNALDAMDRKGTLTLRTYRDKPARKVYLEVCDTGVGIPAENLSAIFDPFFTTKETGKGTGLGLSTAYGVLKENGADIWVKETSSGGTTFILEFPLYRAADEPHLE
ncbi:MAG: PAS domain S-box protein [Syntrophobacteraceae bacterium]